MGMPLESFPDWPAAMTREVALAYTSVAEAQMIEWEKSGAVAFRRRGPHGAMIAQRRDLDMALNMLFGGASDGGEGPIEL